MTQPSPQASVLYEVQDGIATLTLNEGERMNPLSESLQRGVLDALRQVREDMAVRALLITGRGRGFCSGADLKDFSQRAAQSGESLGTYVGQMMAELGNRVFTEIRALPVPVVCAVNGAAAGGGFGLALAADMVIAARSAYFYLPFVPALGLVPDMAASWLLPRVVGRARALGLALTGEKLSAEKAAAWGLIWACVEDAELQSESRALAARLAALPAHAITETRALFDSSERNDLHTQLDLERARQQVLIDGESFAEGLRAFAQKRPPASVGVAETRTPRAVGVAASYAIALFVVLAWSSNYSVLKALLTHLGPSALLAARYLLTPLCAVAVMCWSHGWRWPRLKREEWGVIAVLALLGHVAHVTVMTHAMNLSTPFSSALISACGPLFTLLIVRFTGSHRFSGRQVAGLVLAIAGVLVFLSDKLRASAAHSIGDVLLLVGTVLFACHTVAARRAIDRLGVLVVMSYTTFAATVPILVMNLPGALAAPWGELSSTLWLGLVYSLTIASFGGWLAWGWLNATLGVPRTAPLLYLLPPVTGLIAWSTLGETFTAMKIAGSVMALGGVALAQSAAAQPVAVSADVK